MSGDERALLKEVVKLLLLVLIVPATNSVQQGLYCNLDLKAVGNEFRNTKDYSVQISYLLS